MQTRFSILIYSGYVRRKILSNKSQTKKKNVEEIDFLLVLVLLGKTFQTAVVMGPALENSINRTKRNIFALYVSVK